jgi:hypothetical protein
MRRRLIVLPALALAIPRRGREVMESTWETLELPVLRALYQREEREMPPPRAPVERAIGEFERMALEVQPTEDEADTISSYALEVLKDVWKPRSELERTISRLRQDGYLEFPPDREWPYLRTIRLTGRGLRAIGVWPSENSYEALLQVCWRGRSRESRIPRRRVRLCSFVS